MRSLNTYLETATNDDVCSESLLDNDSVFLSKTDKKIIEKWINDNYNYIGRLSISNDRAVHCPGPVVVKNKSIESLTNGLFRWGWIKRSFYCNDCKNLKTLEGAPEKVGESFWCRGCTSLTTLEGSPKSVGGDLDCSNCKSLETLSGCPEFVGLLVSCKNCPDLKITDSDRKKYKIVG